ncbi:protein of unknown function [Taphrina deformans PYCC 5710]|uniref:Kinesin-like protein n=1 Tax=Taphrina deformans (strain PYCC 5710 / ATCC 11124 / CBS 356.35 / IMI 108563 / JCM 9778 / NBRC 8474) TaxID=1097556 RepID=R4XFV6_TAPDE|nr:protein of unknown function [Taphrina deformans PYCC 5710]|eukprot:CCG84756.1 protein of unknown function [Taphrina deformans PYCC 5710]
MSSNIKVVCRFRPVNKIELANGHSEPIVDFVDVDTVKIESGDVKDSFTFDRVFDMRSRQQDVFDYSIKSTVDDILNGYNGTVFAYGQTGAGKSFTMMGVESDRTLRGVIPRIIEQVFDSIAAAPGNMEYTVKVSYMEIYMEKIRDLLAPMHDNLPIHEDKSRGVYVKGLLEVYVGSLEEVSQVLVQGGHARATSSTNMNAESSRSHSIFVVTVTQKNIETGSAKSGQLFLVDLAGSEKVGKTGASGQTLEEAKKINKSLSALGMVINSLTDGKSTHVPYRDSKLTRILQESLGGNSRTTLIINCSPSAYNDLETLSTLRFGMRAKSIKNKAKVNAELSPAELKVHLRKARADILTFQEYAGALEGEVSVWRSGGQVSAEKWAKLKPELSSTNGIASTNTSRVESLRDTTASPVAEGRSATPLPGSTVLDKDEKDEFLRRENELQDQIADKESSLSRNEELVAKMKIELETLRNQYSETTSSHEQVTAKYNEIRLIMEKTAFEQKEAYITMDSLKEANSELTEELEEVKKALLTAKLASQSSNGNLSTEEKERKKVEKMRSMMAGFESTTSSGAETLGLLIKDLDNVQELKGESLQSFKNKIAESQAALLQTQRSLEDRTATVESLAQRKQDLEARLLKIESEYQLLLEKTLTGAGVQDIDKLKLDFQASYDSKVQSNQAEIVSLRSAAASRADEVEKLTAQIESFKREGSNAVNGSASHGFPGISTKTVTQQLAEFDTMKKSLMRDLQTRCERVVELEIALDETREQYNNVLRNTNNRAQQKKMAFLERNLEQLTNVQRQLVEQNSTLKKEVAIAERKLLARNERIASLEVLLGDAQEKLSLQNQKFENQLQAVRDRLESARKSPSAVSIFGTGKIAKPLRGGASHVSEGPTSPTIQAIKTDSVGRRSSWFRGSG